MEPYRPPRISRRARAAVKVLGAIEAGDVQAIERAKPQALRDGWELYQLRQGTLVFDYAELQRQVLQNLGVAASPPPTSPPISAPEHGSWERRWEPLDMGENTPLPPDPPSPATAPTPAAAAPSQRALDGKPQERHADWEQWRRENCSCSPLIRRRCEVPGHEPPAGGDDHQGEKRYLQ